MPQVTYDRGVRSWKPEDEEALKSAARESFFSGDLSVSQTAAGKEIRLASSRALPITIYSYSSMPVQRYRRTRDHIRRNNADLYLLWIIETGFLRTQQSGYTHIASERSVTVTEADIPFLQELSPSSSGPFSAKIALLPGQLFRSCVSTRHGFYGKPISSETGIGKVIRSLVDVVYEEADKLSISTRSAITEQILKLLEEASYDVLLDIAPSLTAGQRRKKHIFAYIDANLLNRNLDPQTVASDCGISKGHLHRMFSNSGTSFSRYVQSRRLDLARDWLCSQEMVGRTIGEIAEMSAFMSTAHFSRSFKQFHGITPSEARRLCPQTSKPKDRAPDPSKPA